MEKTMSSFWDFEWLSRWHVNEIVCSGWTSRLSTSIDTSMVDGGSTRSVNVMFTTGRGAAPHTPAAGSSKAITKFVYPASAKSVLASTAACSCVWFASYGSHAVYAYPLPLSSSNPTRMMPPLPLSEHVHCTTAGVLPTARSSSTPPFVASTYMSGRLPSSPSYVMLVNLTVTLLVTPPDTGAHIVLPSE